MTESSKSEVRVDQARAGDEVSTQVDSESETESEFSLAESVSEVNGRSEAKTMRGIMMSSHNVSSVNDIDNNRMLLNEKIMSANNRRSNQQQQQHQGPQHATYSVDLSHASRDPMISAAPNEAFNKNDVKLAIEIKQKKLQRQQTELENKLRELEQQEMELEKHTWVI